MSLRSRNDWLTDELLDRIVAYLDDPSDRNGVWRGLGFMEANAIDMALSHGQLHAYLTDETYSPIEQPQSLTHEQEREIVLALRDRLRRTLGLPPLTAGEKAAWVYEPEHFPPWPPEKMVARPWGQTHHPSPEEVADVRQRLAESEPEINRVMTLIGAHNQTLGDRNEEKVPTIWLNSRLKDIIRQLRPDLDASGAGNMLHKLTDNFHGRL
jgi:hypothetical protein